MKIALLSGAIKNAGDYLIVDRSKALIEHVYSDAIIKTYTRNYSLEEQLNEINNNDVTIIAGGPSYHKNLYPQNIPLIKELDGLKTKLFILGAGWYGNTISEKEIWNYRFKESSLKLLRRVENDSKFLGCRDYYAVKVLAANGFKQTLMTGCPAWYNLDFIELTKIRSNSGIKNICISDPANVRSNGKQSIEIAKLLKHAFPTANIKYIFHRGICKDPLTSSANVRYIEEIRKNLQILDIPYYDIAYGKDGFKHYTNCDLHVGHRVHAHIYNLSCRNRSILLEEDARGSGVNEALGLWGIKAYERRISSNASLLTKGCNKLFSLGKTNHYATENLKACLDYLLEHDDIIFTSAFRTMQDYYACMNQHIASIEHIL